MLTELALTPDIFDPSRNGSRWEWEEQLRRLMWRILPRGQASPVVISDLCHGAWYHEVLNAVKNMEDPNARVFAQNVVNGLKKNWLVRSIRGRVFSGTC